MGDEGSGVGDRGAHDQWRRLGPPTPHLTSPLEGERDELWEEEALARAGKAGAIDGRGAAARGRA